MPSTNKEFKEEAAAAFNAAKSGTKRQKEKKPSLDTRVADRVVAYALERALLACENAFKGLDPKVSPTRIFNKVFFNSEIVARLCL